MKNTLVRFFREEEGQGMTEYGLIIALVAIVVIGGLTLLGGNLGAIFNSIAGNITP